MIIPKKLLPAILEFKILSLVKQNNSKSKRGCLSMVPNLVTGVWVGKKTIHFEDIGNGFTNLGKLYENVYLDTTLMISKAI